MSAHPSEQPAAPRLVPPVHPDLRPLLRADGALQLGHDPVHGLLLDGLTDAEVAPVCHLLRLLAGAVPPLPSSTLARRTGLSSERILEVSAAVEEAGLSLTGPPVLSTGGLAAWSLSRLRQGPEIGLDRSRPLTLAARRAGARVTIDGRGTLPGDIARLLTAAQVGELRSGCYAAVSEDLDSGAPDPSLVITVGSVLPRSRAADWQSRGIAHLPVVARAASIDIGPLIIPGRGPCITCIAAGEGRARTAPGFEDPVTDGQTGAPQVEPSLMGIAAGAVAMLALGHLDAYPPPLGLRWHSALPFPSLATTRWPVHPDCPEAGHRRPAAQGAAESRPSSPGQRAHRGVAAVRQ